MVKHKQGDIRDKIAQLRDRYRIDENLTLGLDIGIASCGWALVDLANGKIEGAGTWAFEAPEVPKTKASKAADRRVFRGQRRRLRRRRQRMRDIRQLLHEHGLLETIQPQDGQKGTAKHYPWKLRAEGLDRKLTGTELATALIHIAKHRGYQSNSKSEQSANAPAEDKKALVGLADIKEKSARYTTVGEMFYEDEEFADKKRNKKDDYSHTVYRDLHREEVKKLFERQLKFGNALASEELQKKYEDIAFFQLPLQDSEVLLGHCPFEKDQKRSSALGFSFERFRYLSKLVHTRIHDGSRSGRSLRAEELGKAVNGFGKGSKSISWKRLINLIGLPKDTRFVGIDDKGMGKDVARNSKGCAFGSNTIYSVVGESAWNSLAKTPEILDAIAQIITFREDKGRIEKGLKELNLPDLVLETLMQAVHDGKFAGFSKAGHISAKAARNIIPGLLQGKVYSEACELAGYDHTTENPAKLDAMNNPVAIRAVRETLKQVNTIVREFGLRPGAIHMELGRDVGKGPNDRKGIEDGIKKRTAEREKAKQAFLEMFPHRSDCSTSELMRYELWMEQFQDCMFCYPHRHIEPHELLDGENASQIEHVLPRSRSQDNSWNNKVLACTKCNQNKRNKTPYEWFGQDAAHWNEFAFRVRTLRGDGRIKGFKIRNLLMKDFDEREKGFIERNKNDMRYAARVAMAELRGVWSGEENGQRRRMYSRPGQITGTLRHLWGLDSLKYLRDEQGKKTRIEDERHHGVDAIVVAACDESTLNRMTRAMQDNEKKGLRPEKIKDFPPPWPSFAQDVHAEHETMPVARSENRRTRGAGHAATVRKVRNEEGRRIAYERYAVDSLPKDWMDRVKDPDRNKDLMEALFEWQAAGSPADEPPRRANGHPIKKVTLRSEKNPTTQRAGFMVCEGLVDNADMVRLDVFEKQGKFYLVPIYAHQMADKQTWPTPPNRAITRNKVEDDWTEMDEACQFKFSLFPFSWVEVTNKDGVVLEGYYRGADRNDGRILLSAEKSRQQTVRAATSTCKGFKKYHVDRLGNKSEIKQEPRLWHGVVCT